MAITMKEIKELRGKTGAGVLDCKKALVETNGNINAAIEYLREKGIAAASKKSGRIAAEGMTNVYINEEKNKGIIVEVNSETDFVAKNTQFKTLVKEISEHILQSSAELTDKLLNEAWYRNNDKSVDTVIKEAIASIGENINLRRFKRYHSNGFLQGYIHMGGKISVIVDIEGDLNDNNDKIARDIAMHIAASNPEYLKREDISTEVINKEKEIYTEQMKNEGKPEYIIDNIVKGKLEKFFNQVCLLEQPFVKDLDITITELLNKYNLRVVEFSRYELGEGIEREEEDFASEVMAEIHKK
jgi:elongation factor Ts